MTERIAHCEGLLLELVEALESAMGIALGEDFVANGSGHHPEHPAEGITNNHNRNNARSNDRGPLRLHVTDEAAIAAAAGTASPPSLFAPATHPLQKSVVVGTTLEDGFAQSSSSGGAIARALLARPGDALLSFFRPEDEGYDSSAEKPGTKRARSGSTTSSRENEWSVLLPHLQKENVPEEPPSPSHDETKTHAATTPSATAPLVAKVLAKHLADTELHALRAAVAAEDANVEVIAHGVNRAFDALIAAVEGLVEVPSEEAVLLDVKAASNENLRLRDEVVTLYDECNALYQHCVADVSAGIF